SSSAVPLSTLLSPHPELPTLSYTTLFRSPDEPARALLLCEFERFIEGHRIREVDGLLLIIGAVLVVVDDLARLRVDHDKDSTDEDRKSTRLNSSHVSISYAVFCLKKKSRI